MVTEQVKGNQLGRIILGTFLPVLLTVVLFFSGYHMFAVPFIEGRLLETKKEMIKELTNSVWNLLQDYNKRAESGELTLEEAQQRAAARVRTIRYGYEGKDYFWINDMQPVMIMHPYTVNLEGKDLSNYTDPEGTHLFLEFVDVVENDGAGYVAYMWQWKDDSTNIVPKISYVRGFEEWDWIIGTGIYVEDVDEWIGDITRNLNLVFSVILIVIIFIGIYLVAKMVRVEKEKDTAVQQIIQLQFLLGDIIDSMPSILIGIDQKMNITQWNKEAEKITNQSFQQVQGRQLDQAFPLLREFRDKIGVSIISREKLFVERIKWEIYGKMSCYDLMIYPLQSPEHQGAVLKIDNIDDKIKIEEMMIQTEKMFSVGGLAAGMAHEINNPLAGIMQNVLVIKNRLSEDLPVNRKAATDLGIDFDLVKAYAENRQLFEMIDDTVRTGKRASAIVDNMLNFSRDNEAKFEPHNLKVLLESSVELAQSDYDLITKTNFRNIAIHREYEKELPFVYCDSSKIRQVFLNILKNSAESIDKRKDDFTPQIDLVLKHEDGKVRVEIGDNGIGMNESTRKRVFEPFFTTKKVGAGTGLGLSIAYFIIKENHEGSMNVISSPNKGAKFIMRIPIDKRVSNG